MTNFAIDRTLVSLGAYNQPIQTGPGSAGVISFLSWESQGRESAQGAVTIVRRFGTIGEVSVTLVAEDISAVNGVHYNFAQQELTWEDGDAQPKTIFFALNTVDENKTFRLKLIDPVNFATVDTTYGQLTFTILDRPLPAGQVGLLERRFYQNEQQSITIDVWRTSGTDGPVSVGWYTEDASAVEGSDYTGGAGTLNWGHGEGGPKSIALSLGEVSSDAMFRLKLENPQGGVFLDTLNQEAEVNIVADAGGAGSLGLVLTVVPQSESSTLNLKVRRLGGKVGAVSCSHATANITATAGTHYTSASGTLNWANGDDTEKTITVTISSVDELRQFRSTLSSPSGASLLSGRETTTISILNTGSSIPMTPGVVPLGVATPYSAPMMVKVVYTEERETLISDRSLILQANAISSAVIGFAGGTASFGHGLELKSADRGPGGNSKDKRFRMRKVRFIN